MKILETRASLTTSSKNNLKNLKQSCDVVDIAGGTRRRSIRSLSPPDYGTHKRFLDGCF